MRILILLETLTIGGAEIFGLRLANALAARHEVMLAVMHGERVEPGLRAQLAPGIRFASLRLPAKRNWHRLDTLLRRLGIDRSPQRAMQRRWLLGLIRSFRPDAIHSHLLKADRLVADAREGAGHPVRHVLTMHGDYAPYLAGHADPQMIGVEQVASRIMGSADAIVAICDEHRDFLLARYPAVAPRLHQIRNGYVPSSRDDAPPLDTREFRFGMLSRGVRLKGWEVAIAAFEKVGRPDTRLVLVGDGPFLDELRSRPQPPGVEFRGATTDPLSEIRRFDVALLPTLFPHESLPTVIIEYLVSGKPVIATDVGAIREMITAPDGSLAGRLLRRDGGQVSPDELARHMAELLDDPGLRQAMQISAMAAAGKFDMATCMAANERLYS
ncbi:glycosyltransferase family 4 protein [Sphingomonas ginkgonis]|uniref:glycosyltransferase family 4 protein n=1 Tax=Sphingomonas ginkgonis TaxID=2315330 RepID=UPI001639BBE5|nr:glycosyltransferase family 4 protein [Sphingomonas ginkgonis]